MDDHKLIVVGGLPKCGKTSSINQCLSKTNVQIAHLCRENYDDVEGLEAWKLMVDDLYRSLWNDQDIIFDSCGANQYDLTQCITIAKLRSYSTHYVFYDGAPFEQVMKDILQSYKDKFVKCLPIFKRLVDHFYIAKSMQFISLLEHIIGHSSNARSKI